MISQLYVNGSSPDPEYLTKFTNSLAPSQNCTRPRLSLPYSSTVLPSPSSPTRPGSSIVINSHSEVSLREENHSHFCKSFAQHWHPLTNADSLDAILGQTMAINVLPDDVLLAIFDFYVDEATKACCGPLTKKLVEGWQPLVHVCQRWRSVVFGSPRHLNLRLGCNPRTPQAAKDLDIWPALPLFIWGHGESVDNILALLEHSNRVCEIHLDCVSSLHLEDISAAMQVPFPELMVLGLGAESGHDTMSVLPDSFLGGSAPRLQTLVFQGIPFPGLPRLLLSATHLVTLSLFDIPHSGYIPPEAMVTALSTLTCLQLM